MTVPLERCTACGAPAAWCVCDRLTPHTLKHQVLILRHPQESREPLGSAPLLQAALPSVVLKTGLSWPSLAAAVGAKADADRWGVLWRGSLPRELTPKEQTASTLVLDRQGNAVPARLQGVVVLDGTWSQGKTLWWRNPWLLKLHRVLLWPSEPSIYGKLRPEPRREALSTLEAVAETLQLLGEPDAVRDDLRRLFRTFVQRARDVTPPRPSPPE